MSQDHESLENLLTEDRHFLPSPEFAAQANAQPDEYAHANKDRLAFWEEQASKLLWDKKWDEVLEWKAPYAKWFLGGKINASVNALAVWSLFILKVNPEIHEQSLTQNFLLK